MMCLKSHFPNHIRFSLLCLGFNFPAPAIGYKGYKPIVLTEVIAEVSEHVAKNRGTTSKSSQTFRQVSQIYLAGKIKSNFLLLTSVNLQTDVLLQS